MNVTHGITVLALLACTQPGYAVTNYGGNAFVSRSSPSAGTVEDFDSFLINSSAPGPFPSSASDFGTIGAGASSQSQDGKLGASAFLESPFGPSRLPDGDFAPIAASYFEGSQFDTLRQAQAVASYGFFFTATRTVAAPFNIRLDRTVALTRNFGSDYTDKVGQGFADYFDNGATTVSASLGEMQAIAGGGLFLYKTKNGAIDPDNYSSLYFGTEMKLDPIYSFDENGDLISGSETRKTRTYFGKQSRTNGVFSQSNTDIPVDPTFASVRVNRTDSLLFEVEAGMSYYFQLQIGCQVYAPAFSAFAPGSTDCLASNSLVWEGVGDGSTSIPDFGFISPSGIDYRYSSLLSDTPLNPVPGTGVIPEPKTWALMLAGFAMLGAAVRRRRPAGPSGIA